jgi:hypothetical protein
MNARSFAVGWPLPLDESTPAKAALISSIALFACAARIKRNASLTTSLASSNSPERTWLLTKFSKADGNDTFITFTLPRSKQMSTRFARRFESENRDNCVSRFRLALTA